MPRILSEAPALTNDPSVPLIIQRALRRIQMNVGELQNRVRKHKEDIDDKLGPKDYTKIAAFVRTSLQATGSHPLNISDLQGISGQPQPAFVPAYNSLPAQPKRLGAQGQLVLVNGQLYRYGSGGQFGGTGTDVLGGSWSPLGSSAYQDTHANRLANFPATSYPAGTQFFETDRKVLYIVAGGAWGYVGGTMTAVAASRPTDLGTADTGFNFLASDTSVLSVWSGTAWLNASAGNLLSTANTWTATQTFNAAVSLNGPASGLGASAINFSTPNAAWPAFRIIPFTGATQANDFLIFQTNQRTTVGGADSWASTLYFGAVTPTTNIAGAAGAQFVCGPVAQFQNPVTFSGSGYSLTLTPFDSAYGNEPSIVRNTTGKYLHIAQGLDVRGGLQFNITTTIPPSGEAVDSNKLQNGQCLLYAPTNTQLVFYVRGTDGVLRSASLTLV